MPPKKKWQAKKKWATKQKVYDAGAGSGLKYRVNKNGDYMTYSQIKKEKERRERVTKRRENGKCTVGGTGKGAVVTLIL